MTDDLSEVVSGTGGIAGSRPLEGRQRIFQPQQSARSMA
jgi:hypothetical protein